MKSVIKCAAFIIALVTPALPATAHTELSCATIKVTIRNASGEERSSRTLEYLDFSIDDAAKVVIFADGRQLRIRRFDDFWISAERDDIRSDGTLTYAGSIVEGNTSTTVVGSGRCVPHGAPSLR
jgi:hypothetical protein